MFLVGVLPFAVTVQLSRIFVLLPPSVRCWLFIRRIYYNKRDKKKQTTAFWCTRKSGARNRIFAWFLFCTRCVNNKSCQRAGVSLAVSVWEFWEYVMRFEKIQTNVNEAVNKSAQNIQTGIHTYIEEIILTCANLCVCVVGWANVISAELIDWLINRNIKSSKCCKWK